LGARFKFYSVFLPAGGPARNASIALQADSVGLVQSVSYITFFAIVKNMAYGLDFYYLEW